MTTINTGTQTGSLIGTALSAPIEMLGAHAGVNIIDPATVLTRQWYFDGKFLRAAGFRIDQEYVRSLVALSNQATGHGVAHGYDVDLTGGDQLRVEGGLGLSPSGRVVYLPQAVDLSIATLIARSSGTIEPDSATPGGVAEFAPCPPDEPGDPDLPLPPRPLYVLTVAAVDALCGEEERFGQLCEDACAAETDRSLAVDGVCFRVRRYEPTLPTSRLVPFDGRHLRSQVASAWFQSERHATPSMISGIGLRSGVWCDGAEGVGGEEIALAVFDRSGTVTTWLDMWTARRELMEASPQRYWAWRLAMRPWDVFLAQVLQFQCQLLTIGGDGSVGGGGDPCADERAVLADVSTFLDGLPGKVEATGAGGEAAVEVADHLAVDIGRERREAHAAQEAVAARLAELRKRLNETLSGFKNSASGSLLVDSGIIETPSGAYLPVDPAGDVEAQVRALMGPGVDLRFCAVRPDFIPEALLEAQHMERISLTRGIDDPGDLEEVDVLVPGGVVAERDPVVDSAFEGVVRILPGFKTTDDGRTQSGSALSLSAVARDQTIDGWSWSLAAHGEAPHRLAVSGMFGAIAADLVPDTAHTTHDAATEEAAAAASAGDAAVAEEVIDVHIEADQVHDTARAEAEFMMRANRERHYARERAARVETLVSLRPDRTEVVVTADRAVLNDEKRPVDLWFDVETADLSTVPKGGRASGRLRLSLYSRAKDQPVVIDANVIAGFTVTGRVSQIDPATGQQVDVITTAVDGTIDGLFAAGGQPFDPDPKPFRGLELVWTVGREGTAQRIFSVAFQRGATGARFATRDTGAPRHVASDLDVLVSKDPKYHTADWHTIDAEVSEATRTTRLLTLTLDEAAGVLADATPGRQLAEAAISVIGTELAVWGRDTAFTPFARSRMFDHAEPLGATTIGATADWVMFHRRRTKVCADVRSEQPLGVRRYTWYHVDVEREEDLERFDAMRGRWVGSGRRIRSTDFLRAPERTDQLGFVPVTTVVFTERSAELVTPVGDLRAAWSSAPRGSTLLAGLAGDMVGGETEGIGVDRLEKTVGTLGGLVDTGPMTVRGLDAVPPEFQVPGTDGALFTIGHKKERQELACARLFRVTRTQLKELAEVVAQRDDLDEAMLVAIMNELGIDDSTFVAEFDGIDLVNSDAVGNWWGAIPPVGGAAIVSAHVQADETGPNSYAQHRLPVLAEKLQTSIGVDPKLKGTFSCGAVAFLMQSPLR